MIAPSHKNRIARAFGRAADYATQARVQKDVAAELANRIVAAAPPGEPSILEIGCGTGFLTTALAARIASARWTITDIAPEMIARTSAALDLPATYRVMDGEHPDLGESRFDLIVSSLAFQWFADLPAAVDRLAGYLKPSGLLAFSTMAAGSFSEWRAAHEAHGLSAGTPHYPDVATLRTITPAVDIIPFAQQHADARAFLRQVKAIGAATAVDGRKVLSPAALRRVMGSYDQGPRMATYQVAFCLFRAPAIG